jgi:dolichol kinase
MPAIYFFVAKTSALKILIPLTVAFLIVDVARHYHTTTAKFFYRIFGFMLRKHERDNRAKNLNGATWFLMTATFCVAIFPKYVTVTSFAILVFSDTAAALIGRRFGRRRFRGRSFEGSVAFVVAALFVIVLTPKIEYHFGEYLICAFAATTGATAEVLSCDKIDDNISIPISIGVTMWLLYTLIYPAMNIYEFGFCK